MALKSGQMAGLKVNPDALKACKRYLDSCGPRKLQVRIRLYAGSWPDLFDDLRGDCSPRSISAPSATIR